VIRSGLLVAIGLLAACDPPPLTLRFSLTDGDSYRCTGDTGQDTTSCSDITMLCTGVLSVRIVPPDHPEFPYTSVCKVLSGAQGKLCSIAGVDLPPPAMPVPEQTLEVQMAVFNRHDLPVDGDGNPICPRIEYAADGFPAPQEPCSSSDDPNGCVARPAVAGRAYYHPGDEETVVELGCIELSRLTSCSGPTSVDVFATVNDFDTVVPVGETTADRLTVSIGEPKLTDSYYALTTTFPLNRSGSAPPTWSGIGTGFSPQASYCLEVFEDVPQATRALTCTDTLKSRIDITGYLLARSTLSQILAALGKPIFPDEGLVVGVVLDRFNRPVANAEVKGSLANTEIKYLSADRMSLGTTATSTNGIWISTNAPYNSTFVWTTPPTVSAFGGLVEGKVTIVVLQQSTNAGG